MLLYNPLDYMEIRRGLPNNAFGMVRNNGTRPHQGWDLWALVGSPIYAVSDGVIEFVRTWGDYGTQISLSFEDKRNSDCVGLLYAFYAHLSQTLVVQGEVVDEGQLIGYTGMTGNASRVPALADQHLHFEIRDIANPGRGLRNRLNPADFFGYDLLTSSTEISPVCEVE